MMYPYQQENTDSGEPISHIGEVLAHKEIPEPQKKEPSIMQKLTNAIIDSEAVLFHDQLDDTYIAPMGNGTSVIRLRSRAFKKWLAYFGKQILGKPLTHNVMTDVIADLEGEAQHTGKLRTLSVRVAEYDEALWYDLGKYAVRVGSDRWQVEYRPPILFQRFNHQKPQVEPEPGGSLDLLDDLLPYSMRDDQRFLFKVSLVTGLLPHIPQTVDVIFGDHGSAKSTLTKIKKAVLDPSVIDELTPPTSLNEFIQLLAHHWYVPLGNLTHLSHWMSDCISRASTGGGFSKRELYSDNDDVIYEFIRIIGLNGINLVAEKADLLDRSLLFGDLERIPKDKRREDKALWQQFEERKPQILGAMFEALSKARSIFPTIQLAHIPRMADFTRWGCAIAEALGERQQRFIDVYAGNIENQHEEAIAANPIGAVLVSFMESRKAWQGTPSALLNELQPIAEVLRIDKHRSFPKNAHWVWRRIKEVRVNLLERGIICATDRTESERTICLTRADNTPSIPESIDDWEAALTNSF
jgi:hypothetical protein